MKTRAEQLVENMAQAYPYGVFAVDTAFEYIEQGGQVDIRAFREWMQTNGYWRGYFEEEPEETLRIKREDLFAYFNKYGVTSEEELSDYLWYDCGVKLIVED